MASFENVSQTIMGPHKTTGLEFDTFDQLYRISLKQQGLQSTHYN